MSRCLVCSLAVLAMIAVSVTADAQPPQRRGGRPMMRGGFGSSSVLLLRIEAVRKELDLTEQQQTKLKDLASSLRGQGRPNFDREAMRKMSPEERREKMQGMRKKMTAQREKMEKKVAEILDAKQLKRLEQIRAQVDGPMSPDVARKLGVTDEQKQKMGEFVRKAFQKAREARTGGGRPDPAEMGKMMAKVRAAALDVLTDEQKAKYKELTGEPIDFSKMRGGMMMGGRGMMMMGGRGGPGRAGSGNRGSGKRGSGKRGSGKRGSGKRGGGKRGGDNG